MAVWGLMNGGKRRPFFFPYIASRLALSSKGGCAERSEARREGSRGLLYISLIGYLDEAAAVRRDGVVVVANSRFARGEKQRAGLRCRN